MNAIMRKALISPLVLILLATLLSPAANASPEIGARKCKGQFATIVGTTGDDVLVGTNGRDVIWGGAGDDVINALDGHDLVCGGVGDDTIDAGAGHDRVFGAQGADIMNGGPGNDVIVGDRGFDVISGDDGDDTLQGGGGQDTLLGGDGDDKIRGNAGADRLDGGVGNDLGNGGRGHDVCTVEHADLCEDVTSLPGPPKADMAAGVDGLDVTFFDLSRGQVDRRLWEFGDGVTSTESPAHHTYAAPGMVAVSLTVWNAYGSDKVTRAVEVRGPAVPAAPTAGFEFDADGLSVDFTDTSVGTVDNYEWAFGDGSTSTAQTPSHTYAASGTYSVTLTVSNTGGSNSFTRIISVVAKPPPPEPPRLKGYSIGPPSPDSITISYRTDPCTTAEYTLYRRDSDVVSRVTAASEPRCLTDHTKTFSGLEPCSDYSVNVLAFGNGVYAAPFNLAASTTCPDALFDVTVEPIDLYQGIIQIVYVNWQYNGPEPHHFEARWIESESRCPIGLQGEEAYWSLLPYGAARDAAAAEHPCGIRFTPDGDRDYNGRTGDGFSIGTDIPRYIQLWAVYPDGSTSERVTTQILCCGV